MTKFKVNETVYYDSVRILAEKKVIRAIRQRKFLKPIYLLDLSTNFYEWVNENRLTKIEYKED